MTQSERVQRVIQNDFESLQHINVTDFLGIEQFIKLSVITQFFPPDFAATGQLIEELVKQLEKQGVNVEVFTGQPGYAFQTANAPSVEQSGGLKIRRSRTTQLFPQRIRGKAINGVLFTLRALFYLFNAARHRNVVLLTTAPPFLPILGYIAHILFGVSYVCILYDLYPDIAIALNVIPKYHWVASIWRAINKQVLRKAKGIIVLSPAMKQQAAASCPEASHKISVIHSWANSNFIVPVDKKDNWFAHQHDLVNKFTVLYSGNLGRCHDIHTMLKAAKYLQGEPIQFVCIGGGAKRDDLIREVEQLELENFLFLPYQDKSVLPYSLTACDLSLVSVEPGMENLVAPSKLYSALATGRPVAVICPEHSYLRQLIMHGNCGDTFENTNSVGLAEFIRLLSRDRKLAQSMGQAAREYVECYFTPEVISKQYLRVLQNAMM